MSTAHASFRQRSRRRLITLLVIAVGILITSVCSVLVGQYELDLSQIWPILLAGPMNALELDASVLWQIRLPRVAMGLLVGAALGVSGALMQAVFSNPLAEPSVIGVTSGAGVGAAIAIVFNLTFLGASTVPFAAFIAGLITTIIVYQLSRQDGKAQVITLILVGIAVNAIAGAAINLLVYFAPVTAREQVIFWQMGTLSGGTWEQTGVMLALVLIGVTVAIILGRRLDVLTLGDDAAHHVGLNVARIRLIAIVVSTLLTAGAVAFSGLIGFVGLVVPHILRTVLGPSNRVLIPMSALGGALLIGIADVFARTLIPFADLPIGIFTALIGGPTFFVLLRRMMKTRRQL